MAPMRVIQGTAARPRRSAIEAACDHFRVDRQGNLVSERGEVAGAWVGGGTKVLSLRGRSRTGSARRPGRLRAERGATWRGLGRAAVGRATQGREADARLRRVLQGAQERQPPVGLRRPHPGRRPNIGRGRGDGPRRGGARGARLPGGGCRKGPPGTRRRGPSGHRRIRGRGLPAADVARQRSGPPLPRPGGQHVPGRTTDAGALSTRAFSTSTPRPSRTGVRSTCGR
jgi:hypothetical protein